MQGELLQVFRHNAKRLKSTFLGLFLCALTPVLVGCGMEVPAHMKPLPAETRALLAKKGMKDSAPILVRIFKQESELELWKVKDDGRYHLFKTYPICNWSGAVGPKLKQGDHQAPEGFYRVSKHLMNPNSKFHLSFNLGYPNAYDKAHNRTGKHLMVHGNCQSKGCYAMTDALMEEIYLLAREAFKGGQKTFAVHAFPFRMTKKNFKPYRNHKWAGFWRDLKEGYDYFELTRKEPKVDVCERRYLLNANFGDDSVKTDPHGLCPAYQKIEPDIYSAPPRLQTAQNRVQQSALPTKPGMAHSTSLLFAPATNPAYGLTRSVNSYRNRAIEQSFRLGGENQ